MLCPPALAVHRSHGSLPKFLLITAGPGADLARPGRGHRREPRHRHLLEAQAAGWRLHRPASGTLRGRAGVHRRSTWTRAAGLRCHRDLKHHAALVPPSRSSRCCADAAAAARRPWRNPEIVQPAHRAAALRPGHQPPVDTQLRTAALHETPRHRGPASFVCEEEALLERALGTDAAAVTDELRTLGDVPTRKMRCRPGLGRFTRLP